MSFSVIPVEALDDERLSVHARAVYVSLLSFVGPHGLHPSLSKLAARAGCSVSTTQRALRQLRDLGYVSWRSGGPSPDGKGTPNEYKISYTILVDEGSGQADRTGHSDHRGTGQADQLEEPTTAVKELTTAVVANAGTKATPPSSFPQGKPSNPIPRGLTRTHRWYPHQSAIDAAAAQERYWSVDDYIDRYLSQCGKKNRRPNSSDWFQWFIDDDARARAEARQQAQQKQGPELDESGTPRSWSEAFNKHRRQK